MSAPIPVFGDRPKAVPTPKLRALVKYPGNIVGTTGIEVTKANGTATIETNWNDFGSISAIPTAPTSYILTFDTATQAYVLVPSHLLGGAVAGIADAPNDGTQYGRQSGVWTAVVTSTGGGGITDAPSDSTLYGRKNAGWIAVPAPGIADAPSDGTQYARRNATWTAVPVGGAGITDAPNDGIPYARQSLGWVRAVKGIILCATLADLKAVDTTVNTLASYDHDLWDWTLGNFSAEISADATWVTVKANAVAATIGAWVRRIEQPIRGNLFGGFTAASLQAACNYMARKGGGEVYLPAGSNFILNTAVQVPRLVSIVGGKGSVIAPGTSLTRLLLIQDGWTQVRGVRCDNTSSLSQSAIEVNKAFDNEEVIISDCIFTGFQYAVHWIDGDCCRFFGNHCTNNSVSIQAENSCVNTIIKDNYIVGGTAYVFINAGQGAEGVLIDGDFILPAVDGARAIYIDGGLHFVITNCVIDQLHGPTGIEIIATNHPVAFIKISNNWIGRNGFATGANFGLYVQDACFGVESSSNTYVGFQQAAIYFHGSSGKPSGGCSSRNDIFYYADRSLRDIWIDWADSVLIEGAFFSSHAASIVEGAGTITGRVVNCDFIDTVLPTIFGQLRYSAQRRGMVLCNRGGVVMLGAGATLTVTHGCTFAPDISSVRLQLGNGSPGGVGELIVNNFTTTTFDIQARTAPGASIAIGWEADLTL